MPSDTACVLITGAGGGIGRAIALAFARRGTSLALADVADDAGEQTATLAREAGARAIFVRTDVADEAAVRALVAAAVERFGRVDRAFNNAGIEEERARLAECDEATFDRILRVNVKGVWTCMKVEIEHMLARGGGAIVNTASVAGLVGAPFQSAYAASKHAVIGLTKSAAAEYARDGIRINAVCPAVVRTGMMSRAIERLPERERIMAKLHPMGRVGEPGEIAEAALWLASDAASFVTGHALAVDGGLTAI